MICRSVYWREFAELNSKFRTVHQIRNRRRRRLVMICRSVYWREFAELNIRKEKNVLSGGTCRRDPHEK